MTTSTATSTTTADRSPARGGFNRTVLTLELGRMLRNRRTVIFTLLFPAALFLSLGSSDADWNQSVGHGNVAAYILVSMALYGAALTASVAGAMVAMERAVGWSRQLRLTPLRPAAYIGMKAVVALVGGAVAIIAANTAGIVQGHAHMSVPVWIACALLTLACTSVFAAAGLFVGYLVPGENAMQILGPGLAVLAFLGNVFIPLTAGSTMWHIASFTPMFGVAEVARAPLTGELPWYAVVNVVVWFALFAAGAAWRMSRDTARV